MKIVKKSDERGSILLFMVLFLGIVVMLVIIHFNQLIQQWQKGSFSERRYYCHYNTASSALLWGLKQTWPEPTRNWSCQQHGERKIKVCFKKSAQEGLMLMKGYSKSLSLYLLVEYDPAGKLIYRQGQWFDYCPEKYEWQCR